MPRTRSPSSGLATVASSKVNGVAELHSRLLRERVLPDFAELYPDRFTNVTNGVTPRRFLKLANPELSALITYMNSKDGAEELLAKVLQDPALLQSLAASKPDKPADDETKNDDTANG